MEKNEILNSDWAVRSSAAGNPNTPEYTSSNEEFIITETYVAIKGTNHLWYKHNYPNVAPFYTCGCFCGSREKLISRIYSIDNLFADPAVRMRILDSLAVSLKKFLGDKFNNKSLPILEFSSSIGTKQNNIYGKSIYNKICLNIRYKGDRNGNS